nr:unnamed protein product [Trichobilharzia regenti]
MGGLSKVLYPWMNRKKPFWVKQEANPYTDEDITPENKQFLEQERMNVLTCNTSPIITEQWDQVPWTPYVTQRCGLIAVKLGMYPLWTKTGRKIDCTIYQVPDIHAIRYTPPAEIDKFISLLHPRHYWLTSKRPPSWIKQKRWGIQLVGAFSADPIEFTPEWCNLFKEAGIPPKRKISRFLVSPDAALKPGTPLGVNHFRVGDYLDITARTTNRGFQGVIERWGMKGGCAGHGSTKFHRRMGSAAGCGGPISRGKRMAGVMGNRYRNARGLMILRINPKLGLIYVPGPTPGPVHAYSLLHDSWLKNRRRQLDANPPPVPTYLPSSIVDEAAAAGGGGSGILDPTICVDIDDDFEQDIYHESIHPSHSPSISYSEE